MSVVSRGVRNAFRSGARSVAVVLILAISMGLGLSMLLANQAVKDRLAEVRQSVGTMVLINPAGSQGFMGGGEPLKETDVAKVAEAEHVREVNMSLGLTLVTDTGEDESGGSFMAGGPGFSLGSTGIESGKTNLESSIEPGTIGQRIQGNGERIAQVRGDIKLPIALVGISGSRIGMDEITVTEGRELQPGDTNAAVVGKDLAAKNDLKVGSTFIAYDETFTVVGIFDSGTKFGNGGIHIPLDTAQRISGAGDEISSAVAVADSVDYVETAVTNIKKVLGDTADVTATEQNALVAVESLRSVEKVSIVGFVVALAAAGVIILLTMLMIVRERRREIGVLKAIGGSNRTIVAQFVTEALVLVLISSAVGFGLAAVSSNGIAGALVNSSTESSEKSDNGPGLSVPGGRVQVRIGGPGIINNAAKDTEDYVGDVATTVSLGSLGIGLAAAVVIAVIGSAAPAYLISKVRPAEVLRGE